MLALSNVCCQSVNSFCLVCWRRYSRIMKVLGHMVDWVLAVFAARSTESFPTMPRCAGVQSVLIVVPLFDIPSASWRICQGSS